MIKRISTYVPVFRILLFLAPGAGALAELPGNQSSEASALQANMNEEVTFDDPNMETAVRDALGIPDGSVTTEDMAGLTVLPAADRDIHSLAGLEHAVNLAELELSLNNVSDLSPLADLTGLIELRLDSNNISDLGPLMGLTDLELLWLGQNDITDPSPLGGLTALKTLTLGNNDITDLSPLAELVALETLSINANEISDLSSLAGMTGMRSLSLGFNNITDITPLEGMTGMEMLILHQNQIADLSAVEGMSEMEVLWVSRNAVEDISPLKGTAGLEQLFIEMNQINDLSPLAGLTNLQGLNLADNDITDVSPLGDLTELRVLILSLNAVTDVSPLAGLTQLEALRMAGNRLFEITPLQSLADAGNLSELWVHGNHLDVSAGSPDRALIDTFIGQGADVNFDPQWPQPAAVVKEGPDITVSGVGAYEFTVIYGGTSGLNVSTIIDNNDALRVTGPNDFEAFAEYLEIDHSSNGTPREATYRVEAPDGSWDALNNGAYEVHLQEEQVADNAGLYAEPGAIGAFQVAIPDGDTFQAWLEEHFDENELQDPKRSAPDGDPEGYGIPNLLRYAFDLDPRQPDRTRLPAPDTGTIGDGLYLTITYIQRNGNADLEYRVQTSDNLTEWEALDVDNVVEVEENVDDSTEKVTVRDSETIGESERRYMRVKVVWGGE